MAMYVPFRSLSDLIDPKLELLLPDHLLYFACAFRARSDFWGDEVKIRAAMELEGNRAPRIETFLSRVRCLRELVRRYEIGSLVKGADLEQEDAVAAEIDPRYSEGSFKDSRGQTHRYNAQQLLFKRAGVAYLEDAIRCDGAQRIEEHMEILEKMKKERRILICVGPPGCGKTTVMEDLIKYAVGKGGSVLMILPTGQQAVRMKLRHPGVEVDTVAAYCGLHLGLQECLHKFDWFDLVLIDEFPQLSQELWERVVTLWEITHRKTCLIGCGDFAQLPSIDGTNAKSSPTWARTKIFTLTKMVRCQCPTLAKKLELLRSHVPTALQLAQICRGKKAWSGTSPTSLDIARLWHSYPNTVVAVATKRAAGVVNDLSVKVLFEDRHKAMLGIVPCDYNGNQTNFWAGRLFKADPLEQPLYKGMRIQLTHNKDKKRNFVNGMRCEVLDFHEQSGLVRARTEMGNDIDIQPYTDDAYAETWVGNVMRKELVARVTCYPFVPGYSTTIYKLQGTELDHITVWVDRPFMNAALYMAISRVRMDADYLIGGVLERKHCVPADYKPRNVVSTRSSGQAWVAARQSVVRAPHEAKDHWLPIDAEWEGAIADGSKTVEGRLARGAVLRIQTGDTLRLGSVRTKVVHVEQHESFAAMLECVGLGNALPGVGALDEGVAVYHSFRGYAANEASCGVIALHLEVVRR
jgi:ASC-1-like (ASCH) protein